MAIATEVYEVSRRPLSPHTPLRVGTLTRDQLRRALDERGVLLNESAERLLGSAAFDNPELDTVCVVALTVGDLPVEGDPSLTHLLDAAEREGLAPCPLVTGPYLRLALRDQENAPDSVLSNGSAPSGSLTVASARPGPDLPTGFYLRVIDHVPWLRGYSATDEHHWRDEDVLVFRLPCTIHTAALSTDATHPTRS